ENGSDNLGAVGSDTVHPPPPEDREHDEDAPVGSVDPAEVCRLERGHHTIEEKQEPSQHTECEGASLPEPQPDQVAPADLHEPCQEKQPYRLGDEPRAHPLRWARRRTCIRPPGCHCRSCLTW